MKAKKDIEKRETEMETKNHIQKIKPQNTDKKPQTAKGGDGCVPIR